VTYDSPDSDGPRTHRHCHRFDGDGLVARRVGGPLAAIPSEKLDALLALFAETEHPFWVVGGVMEGAGIEVAISSQP
jgi:hypothetical protein